MGARTGENARAGQFAQCELGAGTGKIGGSGKPYFRIAARGKAREQGIDDLMLNERVGSYRIALRVNALHNDKR
jgi:hypothetical protein